MKIRELVKGDNQIDLMIKAVEEKKASNGKPYLQFVLTDGAEDISVMKWESDMAAAQEQGMEKGAVFCWTLNVGEYNGKPSYKTSGQRTSLVPQSEFVSQITERESMYDQMVGAVLSFSNKALSDLTFYLLNTNKERLIKWSAAKSVHHNLVGGLIYHMFRMYKQAANLVYDKAYDKEMLIAGVILHDIGKLQELETDAFGNAEYTRDGMLFGHAFIGAEMVKDAAALLGTPKDIADQLMHIIVSHHGKLEWGAITLPQTTEAFLCHELDMLDSRMYQYEKICETLEPGSCSERIYSLDGTKVYKF